MVNGLVVTQCVSTRLNTVSFTEHLFFLRLSTYLTFRHNLTLQWRELRVQYLPQQYFVMWTGEVRESTHWKADPPTFQ